MSVAKLRLRAYLEGLLLFQFVNLFTNDLRLQVAKQHDINFIEV